MNEKVAHVLRAGQTRNHRCHWPGCNAQVPPAMWGCRRHWFMLPKRLRDAIWRKYEIGQEERGDPSPDYVAIANEVQKWIEAHHPRP